MRLAFESCVFDSDTREVFRGGSVAPLSPKAFLLLGLLIENRPKAISKEQIRKRLWPDIFVSDANLGNLVAEIRAALNDDAQRPRIIRTVRRFGYAFRARARPISEKDPATSASAVYRLLWRNREIELEPGENLLGRDRSAVAWVDDESVSRRHARIVIDDDGAILEDLGSKNGTALRGRKIRTPMKLQDKDVIKVGPASLVFRVFHRTGSTASTVEKRPRR
jgi:DNA-binding winged helix-turn-helix (wHTH) protein